MSNNQNKGEKKCEKCKGAGWYQYSGFNGDTPHSTICDECCTHDKGFWELKEYYGKNNDKMCCLNGCGFIREKTKDDIAIPQSVEKEECKHCWNTEYENEKVDHQDCENCCNCKISYQDRLKIPQSTTLGTTMEERLATEYKEYENREVELSREKIIRFWLEKLSQSKAETIKEIYMHASLYSDGSYTMLHDYLKQKYPDILETLLSKDIEQ